MSEYAHVFNSDKSRRLISGLRNWNQVQVEFTIPTANTVSQYRAAFFTSTIKKRSDCRYIPILRKIEVYDTSTQDEIYGKVARAAIDYFTADSEGNLIIDSAWAESNVACDIRAHFDILEIYE